LKPKPQPLNQVALGVQIDPGIDPGYVMPYKVRTMSPESIL